METIKNNKAHIRVSYKYPYVYIDNKYPEHLPILMQTLSDDCIKKVQLVMNDYRDESGESKIVLKKKIGYTPLELHKISRMYDLIVHVNETREVRIPKGSNTLDFDIY